MMIQEEPEQDELELETMAELELKRLKRQYRIMENDRVTYAEDARNQLRNQRFVIDKFESEKAELVLAIKAAKSPWNQRQDEAMAEQLRALLARRADFAEQIRRERQQIGELDEQIVSISKELHALKLDQRTDLQPVEAMAKQHRLIGILENRLEVASKRFNSLVGDNAKLRNEIDDLMMERARFNVLWTKLNNQLASGKAIVNDLIEQTTIAFNQRDEELNKINALKDRGMRDLKSHTLEMCELQRTIDNEMKLQEFLGVKGQYREMNDLKAKQQAEKRAKREEMRNKVAMYSQILKLVKQFTGETEIDKLTAQFLKQEEENFALFSYVNELNDELEGLQTRVEQLRLAIDAARALNVHRGQKQAETLELIAQRLQEQTNLANSAERKFNESNETMEKLLKGIEMLFASIKCDDSPLLELLGDNSQVTMNNVMLYLGIIEKRLVEMMNKMHWVDRNKPELRLDEARKPKLQIPVITEIAPTQPCPLCVEKEEMQNVSEGPEVPLTEEEVHKKLMKRLEHDHSHLLHNVSACHLPAARKIIQKRYQ
ncbi:coiled-coil domain-containing protein 63-like [Copidosoma floridanum]|uniref:coiled-coil domain-containing protein 63-like n=1 Tax=Copidosoma floridanum TaxID=29053 RepID=UPI0006C9B94F|nr:coiled-coil domain-containing protein 63-like [Copidosoma floridanum]